MGINMRVNTKYTPHFLLSVSMLILMLMLIAAPVLAQPIKASATTAIKTSAASEISKIKHLPSYLYRAHLGDTPESIAFDFLQGASQKEVRHMFYAHNHIQAKNALMPTQLNQVFNIPMSWMYLKPMPITVLKASGAASVTYAHDTFSATWQSLQTVGSELKESARVRTDNDGFALLEFPDHSLLSISPNSTVLLATVRRYANSDVFNIQVSIENGRVESQVKPLHHPASDYSIRSKRLSTAVRGTRYSVSDTTTSANAITEVLEGGVALGASAKSTVASETTPARKSSTTLVTPGFAAYVADGKVSPLVALLPAPQFVCVAMKQVPIEQALVVIADKKTQAFSLNIYTGEHPNLNQMNPDRQVIDVRPHLPVDLPVGSYTLQLKAIDEHGIHGLASQQKIMIRANPNPVETLLHWQQNLATRSWALSTIPNNSNNKQLTCMD
jgi:hypothetical protein